MTAENQLTHVDLVKLYCTCTLKGVSHGDDCALKDSKADKIRDEWCAEYVRLRDRAAEAVRILSAVEFDGQAYDAITKACALLVPP